jgi:hypothetical protein
MNQTYGPIELNSTHLDFSIFNCSKGFIKAGIANYPYVEAYISEEEPTPALWKFRAFVAVENRLLHHLWKTSALKIIVRKSYTENKCQYELVHKLRRRRPVKFAKPHWQNYHILHQPQAYFVLQIHFQ